MAENNQVSGIVEVNNTVDEKLVLMTHIIYALLATHWFAGITFFVAIIMAYLKLDDVKGTWLESHVRWQINTFWYGLLFYIVAALLCVFVIGFPLLFANFLWVLYRTIKGWLALLDKKTL